MNIWLTTRSQIQSICENLPCWANFVAENIQLGYSKNQNIFVGFLEMLKKIVVKDWILSKLFSYPSVDEC